MKQATGKRLFARTWRRIRFIATVPVLLLAFYAANAVVNSLWIDYRRFDGSVDRLLQRAERLGRESGAFDEAAALRRLGNSDRNGGCYRFDDRIGEAGGIDHGGNPWRHDDRLHRRRSANGPSATIRPPARR